MIAPARNLVRQTSKRFLKSRKTSESKKGLGVRRLSTNFWNEVQQETETHQEDHSSTTLGESSKQLSMNEDASKSDVSSSEKKHKEEDDKKCEIQNENEDTTQEDAQTTLSEEFQRAIRRRRREIRKQPKSPSAPPLYPPTEEAAEDETPLSP